MDMHVEETFRDGLPTGSTIIPSHRMFARWSSDIDLGTLRTCRASW
jgi:hypothetical protein